MTQVANLNTKLSLESASFISGIEKSRGAVRSLIASLDPAAAAQAKFNRETQLLEGAMKRGQISAEAYAKGLEVLRQRMTAATTTGGEIVKSSGSQRAGFQQLSFQIGDIATQYGSGTKAMTIFAQQSGQVIQALGLMTNSTKGLLGFLGGPWGQIITAATIILAPFIAKLFQTADGADAAKDSVLGYADALKKLQGQAGAFKFGSDEFKKANEEFLKAQGRVVKLRQELNSAGANGPSFVTPGSTGGISANRSRELVQADLKLALKNLDNKRSDLSGLILQTNNRADLERAGPPEKNTREKKARKGPADRSDQRLERADDQLAQLAQQRLGLMESITSDVRDQAALQHQQVDAALEAYRIDLDHQVAQKEVTAEKAKELLTAKQRNSELEHTKINWVLDDKLTEQDLDVTRSRLDNSTELLRGELDAARTQRERRRIQLAILHNAEQEERATLEAVQAKHKSTDVEYQIAQAKLDQLDKETSQRAGAITRDTMGPMESYLDSIPKTADEINQAFEHVAADGLQSLNDGLADAITGSRSLGDVFKNVASQIIADLARIAIQKALTGAIGNALGGLFGGGGGITGSSGGMDMRGFSGAVQGMAGGGRFMVGGAPGVDRNILSVNGIPRARVSANENVSVGYGGGAPTVVQLVVGPGQLFEPAVTAISGGVSVETVTRAGRGVARSQRQQL